ncbi:restriction endonuclease subunit S [Prevotellamassilia timonensis]|mgnify:CR=1 FL=1|uniref:restriction endonuclease subunit S n=1 Tax=Prevotellamassilia timonensis TaxID=1852370 RepID=UPI003FED6581
MVKYEQYKDSDIDWVGKVPTSWNRSRIKFLLSHSSAGVWGEDEKGNKNDIVCFRAADFDYSHGCLKLDNNTVRNIQQKQLEGRVLHKRDLLIEKSGGGDATPVGRIVRFNYDGIATCSNFMHFISVDKYNDDNYLFYYFYAMYANNVNVLYFNQTTGIQNLKVSEYLGQTIFLPSLKEQMTIANYLDKKCSEIDKVISAQQKRIALLQELKQSVITHAVTKGLNPNVEMDAAEEDWINRLPASWGKAKLKYYIHLVNGRAYSQPELLSEGKYKVLRVGNFFTNDTWYYSNMELEEDKYCNNGDLLYAWSASFGPYIWNQDKTIYHYHISILC